MNSSETKNSQVHQMEGPLKFWLDLMVCIKYSIRLTSRRRIPSETNSPWWKQTTHGESELGFGHTERIATSNERNLQANGFHLEYETTSFTMNRDGTSSHQYCVYCASIFKEERLKKNKEKTKTLFFQKFF